MSTSTAKTRRKNLARKLFDECLQDLEENPMKNGLEVADSLWDSFANSECTTNDYKAFKKGMERLRAAINAPELTYVRWEGIYKSRCNFVLMDDSNEAGEHYSAHSDTWFNGLFLLFLKSPSITRLLIEHLHVLRGKGYIDEYCGVPCIGRTPHREDDALEFILQECGWNVNYHNRYFSWFCDNNSGAKYIK